MELIICAREEDSLRAVSEEIRQINGRPVHFKTCDLTSPQSISELVEATVKTLGGVDIIIHNTGGPRPTSAEGTYNGRLARWL